MARVWQKTCVFLSMISLVILISSSGNVAAKQDSTSYQAGVAKVHITPTEQQLQEGIYMGGYGAYKTRGKASGIGSEIYARALTVSSGNNKAVFVQLDTTGIGNVVLDLIRNQASEKTGIPAEAIFISATHTHAGPDLQGLWGGVSSSYKEYVVSQTVQAIVQSNNELTHVTLATGTTEVDQKLVNNRRGHGFTDTHMTVLQFQRQGSTLATLVNFAVHPTVLSGNNKQISSDFVGSLVTSVENEFGGMAMFINGAQGDAVPNAISGEDEYARAQEYGKALLPFVTNAINHSKSIPPGILLNRESISFEVQNAAFIGAYKLGIFRGYANLREDTGRFFIDSRVVRLRLGNDQKQVEMVSIPGEAVTLLGLDIREKMNGEHNVVMGLTHDSLGYLIPKDEWLTGRNNNYEETVSMSANAGEQVRQAVFSLYK